MFLKYADISSRECYEYYRENRKGVAQGLNQYNQFKKTVEGLFLLIKNELPKSEHGICIRDLGYFGMLRTPKKYFTTNMKAKSILKKHYKRYFYRPVWFPDVMYEEWHMRGTFNKKMQNKINKSNIKYKLHKNLCESMIVLEDFELRPESHSKGGKLMHYKKESRK